MSLGCQQQGWHESAAGIVLPLRGRRCQGTGSQTNTPLCNISLWGCLTYRPLPQGRCFSKKENITKTRAQGVISTLKQSSKPAGTVLALPALLAALQGIPPPKGSEKDGSSSGQHSSREQHVPVCVPEQKKTTPCNLTATEVLAQHVANSSPFAAPAA